MIIMLKCAGASPPVSEAGLGLADVGMEVRDWASAFALAREGVGVALVPEPTLPADRRGLRVLRLAEPLYRRFGLQASARARSSPAVRALLEVAAGHTQVEAARDARTAATAPTCMSNPDDALGVELSANASHLQVTTRPTACSAFRKRANCK